jgi:aryl-alcohol dehydrogenase-like predicted oxidoreductase
MGVPAPTVDAALPLPARAGRGSVPHMHKQTSSAERMRGGAAMHPPLATAAGTARYRARFAERFASSYFRPFVGDLAIASIGLGTYLGEPDDADDARYVETAREAIASGINVLDTAINYRCQRSERAIGRAIADAIEDGDVTREELIICTKAGYIPLDGAPPPTREAYREYVQREFYSPGVMTPDDVVGGGHSMAPGFLLHQLERSRQNLGLPSIDVFYLHNPEQQLAVIDPAQFRERIRAAFQILEERALAGEIGSYGCATWNGLREPPASRGHLSLARLVAIAREVGGDGHHFGVVQLPINLAMADALRSPTQRLGRHHVPLLQAAAELGVAVVASASLMQAKLTAGLPAQVREAFPGAQSDAQSAIAFVRTLPGVACALVGMRSVEHLRENLGAGKM